MNTNPPAETERPKRLSLSQILEMMLSRPTRTHPSVTLTYTTSGAVTWSIDSPVEEGETVAAAAERIAAVHDGLLDRYPPSAEHDAAEVTLTRNAKGDTQIAVSAKTTPETQTVDEVVAKVRKVYDATRAQYPMPDGMTARPGSVKEGKG
jgi:hypothetical protein